MELTELLDRSAQEIIDEGLDKLEKAKLTHYAFLPPEKSRALLENLYAVIVENVRTRNVTATQRFARRLAVDRYSTGYDLSEVQAAFKVIEESLWKRIMRDLPLADCAAALGVVSAISGAARDALACEFVALAREHNPPLADPDVLFKGTDGI